MKRDEGLGLIVNIFWLIEIFSSGVEIFSGRVEKFSGGWLRKVSGGGGGSEKFRGVEIFSRGVETFQEGLKFFREGLIYFR